ncbi:MAG TPA: hypothetical protein VFQ65_17120 [Kofleriaceae bacterium]|nr:hypothetical protein [Kofleriaceae bacterium]
MRILRTLLWTFVALACAAPTCDTHDVGSGSGSSAWSRMPAPSAPTSAGSAAQHQDVVHAMESVTGASLDHAAKPTKPKRSTKHGDDDGGGRSTSPAAPPPPRKPALPDSGRTLGQPCVDDEQCASNLCELDECRQKSGSKLAKGEKCYYSSDCASGDCTEEVCE